MRLLNASGSLPHLRTIARLVLAACVAIPSSLSASADQFGLPQNDDSSAFLCESCDPLRESAAEFGSPPWSLDTLFRDDCGLTAAPVYYGEVFTNARGGLSTNDATRYEGLLNLPISLDCREAGLPLPGKFHLLAQNTHGQGLSQKFVGDTQVLSNIDSLGNIMQVSEYWWEFDLLESDLAVRLGKQDLNTEFLAMEMAADFINSSFGISPSAVFPTYPSPSMAVVLLAQLSDSLEFKYGVWDGFADGGSWGFSGEGILFHFAELDYSYSLRDGQLPGSLEAGAAYIPGGKFHNTLLPEIHGYYLQVEQLVYRENAREQQDTQGLGVFISYFPRFPNGVFPSFSIRGDVVAGAIYTGLIPSRDKDVIGLGLAWAKLNRGGTNQETAVEFFYQAQISKTTSLQPDIQYIASPSGIYRDALAVGLRFQVEL